jgi:hypothetical protein
MRLEYTLALADFKAARALHRRQKLSRRLIPWTGPILLVISITGLIAGSLMPNLTLASQSFGGILCAIVLTVGMPIQNALGIRRSFNRLFHAGHKDRRSVIEIDDEYIARQLSGMSELKVLWTGVYDFIQDDRVALIYTNKDCFLIIPSQAMSSDQRTELDSFVARHAKRRR